MTLNITAWLNPLEEPSEPTPEPAPPAEISGPYQQRCWRYINAIAERLAATGPGSRNDAQNQGAYRAFRVALGAAIEPDTVAELIYQAQIANGQVSDDGEHSVRSTLRSALSAAHRAGPEYLTNTELDLNGFTLDPNTNGIDPHFIDGATFILDIPNEIPTIWGTGGDVLWMAGESLMIAGPMGLGKTTLAGQLMRAQLGIGDLAVLGYPVTPTAGKILYLAMDRPEQARRALARQFRPEHRDILADKLIVWQGPPPADVAKNPGLLLWLAEKAGADIVYIDSVKDAAVGLSEDEVGAGYNRARQKLIASGRQVCELHHTTKRGAGGGPPKDVADIYGSTWITNGTGSILLLSGQPGDPIVRMLHARQPMNEVGPYHLSHDQQTGEITVLLEGGLREMLFDAGPDGLSARDAAIALFADGDESYSPPRADVERARRRLDALVEDGLASRADGGRGKAGASLWFPAGGVVVG